MKSLVATFLIALVVQPAWTQSPNDSKNGAIGPLPGGWLVSPAEAREFRGEDGFNEPPALRPRAVVPQIDILKPEPAPDLKVKAPFPITVQFKAQNDAAIDPATFKVMYGALKIDITSRITKYVKVSPEGFSLENAQIPAGRHRLTLQVQDEKQRVAERELRVEVE
ncbi:hypothetical protein [Variovorax terrae]|uniref:Uncharacterized protein n=1 Tax=Variovorax terrae TaxID=2923278 RepID=A0A9X1W1X6_9BURK|nr:hypothetical protein [Variovorax terrae]MCJ0764603.1 hypothetical protein [Variovorax terrae]